MLLSDGRVFVCGGYNGLVESSVSSAVYVYTPATDTWQTLNSMLVRRCIHTASLLNDDRVLITGGQNLNSTQESSTEIYTTTANSGTGQSVFGNFLSVSRQTHTATLLQTADVLVIGGENGSIGSIAQNEQYSHTTGAWSEPSSLATSRESHTATLLPSGQVLVTGGTSYTPSGPRTILDSAELF